MRGIVKPIETVYNGYRFRSRLEARWALFFDSAGIEYQYENEGFYLPNDSWYLPDFFLPWFKCYVEIKPQGFSDYETTRDNLLSLIQDNDCIAMLCIGDPMNNDMKVFCADATDSSAGISSEGWNSEFLEGVCYEKQGILCERTKHFITLCVGEKNGNPNREFFNGSFIENDSLLNVATVDHFRSDFDYAKEKARQARFEYGEKG